ncbi:MAG: HlyD family secretion protein, partial [Muribaculaceae bacterium]|nr:HlyD family secretion protein [Muribaculaceae bacterium]
MARILLCVWCDNVQYTVKLNIIMDREIPKSEQRKEARKRYLKIGGVVVAVAAVIVVIFSLLKESIKESDLTIGKAEIGTLESTVSASGKIVPLYELAVVSPVSTKILEVYCSEGDGVKGGEPLLKLDLQSTEIELQRLMDEAAMRSNDIEQAKLNDATFLTDLEMRIKAKEMSVSHLKAEVANERRLDSIGSGTGDRIREAELAYATGQLELEQMKVQLGKERKSHGAALRSRQLEGTISRRNLANMERTLEDARIKAPRKGTVTFLNKNLGTSIGAGEKLAVISDLEHF